MKQISGFCGSGSMMSRMGLWEDSMCRCCLRQPEKTPWHILECTHCDLVQARRNMLQDIQQWMEEKLVDDWLADVLLRLLRDGGWPMEWDGSLNPIQLQLMTYLERIGARGLLLEYLPKGMVEWQKESFLLLGVKRLAELLISQLASKLMDGLHSIWKLRCDIVHERDVNGLYTEDGEI